MTVSMLISNEVTKFSRLAAAKVEVQFDFCQLSFNQCKNQLADQTDFSHECKNYREKDFF
jgi:hypothetical protein